ncbi:hypothetical protein J6X13_03915 [Candidatus Saccharibacteria bacterium]|nr:hypothetical protein [Candidatus Saccharibacteria bacterium]
MHKQKHLHYAIITVAGFALLFMTVGFAAYGQLVSGNSVAADSRYIRNIGFDAASYNESDTSVLPLARSIGKQSMKLSLHLNPGETYASMINIVNNGSENELLQKIAIDGLPADGVDFRINLSGSEYRETTENIKLAFLRGELNRQQMFVTVEARESADLNLAIGLEF